MEQKHVRFFEGLKGLPEPWGLGDRPVPPSPKFKGNVNADVSLTKFFGPGVHRAIVTYPYRQMLTDTASCDDALTITFNPVKVDMHHLTYTVIPKYIEAFDAYLIEFFDDARIDVAAEELKDVAFNPRFNVHYVGPVGFYDELLCRRAFNLSPAEVMERLQGKVEHAQVLHGGVYLIGSSRVLPFDEAQKRCREVKSALLG